METNFDITKEIPSREVIDLSKLPQPLSTKEGFTDAVTSLSHSKSLPKFFPNVPDVHNRLTRQGIVINDELREDLVVLPPELYDSKTYEKDPVLRGPLEEIILANEKEIILAGFDRNHITGDGWSPNFKERFEKLSPMISNIEIEEILDEKKENKLLEDPKGSKIA